MQTTKQCRLKFKLDTEKLVTSFSDWNIAMRKFLGIFQRAFTIEFPVLACMQPAV